MTVIANMQVRAALKMPGGGVFGVGPGQITDDSELALCLAQGLVDSRYGEQQGAVAAKYVQWLASEPFDIGSRVHLMQPCIRPRR